MSREPEVGLKVRELRDSFESVESESSNLVSSKLPSGNLRWTHKLLNPAFRGPVSPSFAGGLNTFETC